MPVRYLGQIDYASAFRAMQDFVAQREAGDADELWICQHPPVYTLGQAGRPEHVLAAGDIPVVHCDRGGQVTYHGPGQVVAYPLVDLRQRSYFAKEYVFRMEEAALRTLAQFGLTGHRVAGAPGVYIKLDDPFGHALLPQRPARREPGTPAPVPVFDGVGKIAALGIKVHRRCCYHGLALNVAMDLEPFARINACGYPGLSTVDMARFSVHVDWTDAAQALCGHLQQLLAID